MAAEASRIDFMFLVPQASGSATATPVTSCTKVGFSWIWYSLSKVFSAGAITFYELWRKDCWEWKIAPPLKKQPSPPPPPIHPVRLAPNSSLSDFSSISCSYTFKTIFTLHNILEFLNNYCCLYIRLVPLSVQFVYGFWIKVQDVKVSCISVISSPNLWLDGFDNFSPI